jgi:hypothetical protein
MDQTQKMKIDPPKVWPFPVVIGVSIAGKCNTLSQFDAVNAKYLILPTTKEPKSKLYEAIADMEEALF